MSISTRADAASLIDRNVKRPPSAKAKCAALKAR